MLPRYTVPFGGQPQVSAQQAPQAPLERAAQEIPNAAAMLGGEDGLTEADFSLLASLPIEKQQSIANEVESGKVSKDMVVKQMNELDAMMRQRQRVAPQTVAASAAPGIGASLGVESGGTYYPENFGATLREAVDSGRISPKQAALQAAKYREWLTTPEGLTVQGIREQNAAKQDLAAIGVQQQAAEATQQTMTADLYNQAAQKISQQEDEWDQLRAEYARNQDIRMAELDNLTTEIQNTRIDPSNYWRNQGALGAALSVIGLALGAYVQGRSMGQVPNLALGELNKAIDRDIDAQKANLDIKGKALEAKKGIYGLVRQRLGDEQASLDYTRGLMKENLANSVAEFGARSATEKAKLAAADLVTRLRADAAQTMTDVRVRLALAERDRLQRRLAAQAGAAAAAERAQYKKEKEALELEKMRADIAKTRGEVAGEGDVLKGPTPLTTKNASQIVTVQGQSYYFPEKQAKDAVERASGANEFISIVDKLGAYSGMGGGFGRKRGAIIDSLYGRAVSTLAKVNSGGKPSDVELEQAEKQLPKPGWINLTVGPALEAQKALAIDSFRQYRQSAGAVPVSIKDGVIVPSEEPKSGGKSYVSETP